MKYIKSFNEALKPSQFRRYVKAFDRERYEKFFQELKSKYSGDKMAYRIYIPLLKEDSSATIGETEQEVIDFLLDNEYEIIDYKAGTCKRSGAKNQSKIGQILTRLKNDKLMKAFVEDKTRKSARVKTLVCLSRHPYDVVGADTDRNWSNCMTMASLGSKRILKLKEEFDELYKKYAPLKAHVSNIELQLSEYTRDDDDKNEIDFDEVDSDDPIVQEYNKLQKDLEKFKKETKFDSIEDRYTTLKGHLDESEDSGSNAHYLISDVKEGSLIAYLIRENDLNVEDPIANWNIKPFVNKKNKSDIILVSDARGYGNPTNTFKETIDEVLEIYNKEKGQGVFCINPNIYDDGRSKVVRLSEEVIKANLAKENDEENLVNYASHLFKNKSKDFKLILGVTRKIFKIVDEPFYEHDIMKELINYFISECKDMTTLKAMATILKNTSVNELVLNFKNSPKDFIIFLLQQINSEQQINSALEFYFRLLDDNLVVYNLDYFKAILEMKKGVVLTEMVESIDLYDEEYEITFSDYTIKLEEDEYKEFTKYLKSIKKTKSKSTPVSKKLRKKEDEFNSYRGITNNRSGYNE